VRPRVRAGQYIDTGRGGVFLQTCPVHVRPCAQMRGDVHALLCARSANTSAAMQAHTWGWQVHSPKIFLQRRINRAVRLWAHDGLVALDWVLLRHGDAVSLVVLVLQLGLCVCGSEKEGVWDCGGWAGGLGEEGCAGRLELWDYEQEVTRAFSKAYTQGGRHTFVKTPGGRVVMSVAQRFEKMRKTPEKSSGGRKKCS
jgi:hypothetical protein